MTVQAISRTSARRSALALLLGGLAAATISCSGAADPPAPARPAVHAVSIDSVRFNPEAIEVSAGDEVVWTNADPFPHTVKADGAFESPSIGPGQRWSRTFSAAGEFAYICTLHPTMKGSVRVRARAQ